MRLHARAIQFQTGQAQLHLRQAAGGEADDLRQGVPFGMPLPGRALVRLRHGAEQCGDQARYAGGCGNRCHAGDRVALVRHRRRAAFAGGGRLERFAHLRLHQQRHIAADLAQRGSQQTESAPDLDDAVARGMPGQRGQRQLQSARQGLRHFQATLLQRGQGAGRAAELQHQGIAPQGVQALLRTLQGVQPTGDLEPEGDRHGLLQQGASGQAGVALAFGQHRQIGAQGVQTRQQQIKRGAQLQHRAGIDDVLAGGAPVHPARGGIVVRGHLRGQRLDQRNGGIAGQRRGLRQRGPVVVLHIAGSGNGLRGLGGNHPALRLCARQRGLELQHRLQARGIVEQGVARGLAEQGSQQRRCRTHVLHL